MFKPNDKPQATKAQVERLAKKLNVEVDDETDESYVSIFLYTPKGLKFTATDCHTAATSFSRLQPGERSNPYEGTKAEGWGHALKDLKTGVEECTNENCGYCERGLMNT
jgi:2-methylcitrate dehydratase PrpD